MESEEQKVGTDTLKTILQLVRYDIPTLIVGKSSIGKSYTLIELTQKWRLPSSILYIGSEKPENIEGLAKLISGDYENKKNKDGKITQKGEDILKFLKPYWFPNSTTISYQVSNGQKIFENYLKVYDKNGKNEDFSYYYKNLHQILICLMNVDYPENENKIVVKLEDRAESVLSDVKNYEVLNSKGFEFIRSAETVEQVEMAYDYTLDIQKAGRDDIRDMSMYLCTLLGYGNYWLILDELDKVGEQEKEKYAPLLHIVRERTLKSWTMKQINNEKGLNIPLDVDTGSYIKQKNVIQKQIENKMPLLDCRVIGIANATKDIEEALFRRFCQIIMKTTMALYPPSAEANKIMKCVSDNTDKEDRMNIDLLLREVGFLDEVNLQWQYSFLPKMLNTTDTDGNFLFQNFNTYYNNIEGNEKSKEVFMQMSFYKVMNETAFGTIWMDNFMGGQKTNDTQQQQLYTQLAKLFICLSKELYQPSSIPNVGVAGSQRVGGGTYTPTQLQRIEMIESFTELGSLYADDLIDNLEKSYEKTKGNISALTNWTKKALSYIRASNIKEYYKGDIGVFDQISGLGDKLIPMIYKVIFTSLRSDSTLDVDAFNSQIIIVEEFFSEFLNTDGENSQDLPSSDKNETEKLFYGETLKKLRGMKPNQQQQVESNSLYGKNYYTDSLSYTLYERYYLKGALQDFIDDYLSSNESFIDIMNIISTGKGKDSNIGVRNIEFLKTPLVYEMLKSYYDRGFTDNMKKSAQGVRLGEILEKLKQFQQ